ncbi:MAG: hypothetical protein QUS14_13665 [Pyrinomonadaceae bacterium]|nr:hypothetical protein [Pyrinomonadaceae bacterium]
MTKNLTIFISGLYSGPNPQPGVGIARSLRQGFPDAKLVGVEYSNRCSGIHWIDLDDVWLQRPWSELDLDLHACDIKQRLDDGAVWISSIDLEIVWLADVFPDGHPNLLVPSRGSLSMVRKPAITAHKGLPVKIPAFRGTDVDDWDLHSFCRDNDWNVWLKGPYYEAVRTPTWESFSHWRGVLSSAWATDELFLQAHVSGFEESVMISAYEGELLECVHMRKRDVTDLGKTWAGDAVTPPPEIVYPLRKIIRDLKWTGGGELEMVRDAEDQLWLLEWNPRFPAWVHGATIAGRNLPAALVEGATGIEAADCPIVACEFTRVVIEVPVRKEFPLPRLPEPFVGTAGHSMKHPSGLVEFAQRLHLAPGGSPSPSQAHNLSGVPESYLRDLEKVDFRHLQTPASLFFESTARETFKKSTTLTDVSKGEIRPIQAYSIKTNPDERLLRLALDFGFYAEAISPLEAQKAVAAGFRTEQLILNGPAKWWRRDELPDGRYHAVFCDSTLELERITRDIENRALSADVVGIRLRTPGVASRFGVPIDSPELFEVLINALREHPASIRFGVHFHMASSAIGIGQWRDLFRSMLAWCSSIESLAGRRIEVLDIGGGWFPGDFQRKSAIEFRELIKLVQGELPDVTELITEPGKALAQSTMALAMSVLEVRRYAGGTCEAVMDGSIADLPMHSFQPHRILLLDRESGDWRPLERGDSLLLGRLCMEHDIVAANVEVPAATRSGDVFVFCDAGAYDRSMSYVFGCG